MSERIVIAIGQLNPTVGDVGGNADLVIEAHAEAAGEGADLLVLGELGLCGYPPEDLVLKPSFQSACREALQRIASVTAASSTAVLIGTPWRDGEKVYDAMVLVDGGNITAARYKHELPNYGVFDEKRLFSPGPAPGPIGFRGIRLGIAIGEDLLSPEVVECLQETGSDILLACNASPFETDKPDLRLNAAVARVTESGCPLLHVNQVGGQDELVFDGASFVLGADRGLRIQAPAWRAGVTVTRWERNDGAWDCLRGGIAPVVEGLEAVYSAMVVGLRDYVAKNRFSGVLVGLSGGIDSALTSMVATDAVGPDRVHCVMMPSSYTSDTSLRDARELASTLGVRYSCLPIGGAVAAFHEILAAERRIVPESVTAENVQARARGLILMALSNSNGSLVVSTGNKSEMSVGFATLYGDMCGGYNVLKDVYKTSVYALSRWRNEHRPDWFGGPEGPVVSDSILTKAPTAELKPNQRDEDVLPPYDALDDILQGMIEGEQSVLKIAARGHRPETVRRVWRMVDAAEYKRRQAAPGVKLTRRAFGRDRRYPITNGYKGSV